MKSKRKSRKPRILAISSSGGHWVQLQRLRPVLDKYDTVYASTRDDYAQSVHPARFHKLTDASRWNKLLLIKLAIETFIVLLKELPSVIITTGAAPGFWAIALGKLFGVRTVWIDSLANADHLSMSGKYCRYFATLHLSQWPELADERTGYKGTVL